MTAPEITAEINHGRNKTILLNIVKRRLQEVSLHGRVAVKKPFLRRGNKQKRLQWAKAHLTWTVEQ